MSLLRRLFSPRRPLRHFAWLDAQGHCRALRQAQAHPQQAGWVEVSESRPCWLGAPLPAGVRVTPVVTHAADVRPLAA
ncbi:hypothetical protein EA796_08055 [Pseudomonas sp. AOB-7]|uniref:hypothetical protein n=1 Tax=Pseudomonas sp. AOB-7 TaxID=2482750 RepID=UPI000EFA6FFD|nr:hypothetical protein [Pseudomonas sp. AOB-7]RMH85454.1 hypothetical protein EA796_08055 [Pseudomonas sp. AOB-7]